MHSSPRRHWHFAALLFCALALLPGCSSRLSIPSETAPDTAFNPSVNYLLEPGNRVRINVFGESNLSGDFQIDSLGNIALPLAGNVPASGISSDALSERIAKALQRSGFLRDPSVNVEIVTYRPYYILGEVRQPGEYPYTLGLTVLSAIAKAGGYDYRAREGTIVLIRTLDGKQTEYRATERTPILPGDILRIPERYL
ncbi:MAG: polysaccharide export protein [Alphaproteobacteria bacterium]|nr:polysaccharide export protein [Alphaproteobacteria bacterium]MBU0796823.1 polysaccharide export protein [Alphaproteobacteria bacterium]MBU0885819.1 polysaccharide export protein [Alphaproteobacteria bacterium]MBU1812104.1 polysaccharide export protein [Alphaproteobacteria bacterium]